LVELRCGAVAIGRKYLFLPLSSRGALVVLPWLCFHIPLIGSRLADFPHPALGQDITLHPRHVVPKRGQAYEPKVPAKLREWIISALASPDLVLDAQPHSSVVVDRPIHFCDGAYFEVRRAPNLAAKHRHADRIAKGFAGRIATRRNGLASRPWVARPP